MDLGTPFTPSSTIENREDRGRLRGVMAEMLGRHPAVKKIEGVDLAGPGIIVPLSAQSKLLVVAEEIIARSITVAEKLMHLIKIGHGPILLDRIEHTSLALGGSSPPG